MFWTGSGEEGLSPLICRTVQDLCSRGTSTLPLGEREQELLMQALARFPAGIGPDGLHILEPGNTKQDPVTIVSMNGSRFNRVLALLLRHGLGRKVQVRYDDFLLTVDGAGRDMYRSVILAVGKIRNMDNSALAGILPLPPAEGWKFARAIPGPFFREMIISDYYHGEDILQELKRTEIFCIPRQEEMPL